mmetsp:Transcript_24723/g.38501  ORF Transcript_24723/g.38501 Transcript_24723/m.38501 type:complete len:92 (-) Transcript_24723:240-515(-)
MDSPVEGKKYSDIVDLTVSPFVLPYHLFSFEMTRLFSYLQPLCQNDASQCYEQQYMNYCWKQIGRFDDTLASSDFKDIWANEVAFEFDLPE